MNKYSSKAVKTAATVGMSLAMVLGNVAPVLADTTTYDAGTCKNVTLKTSTADAGEIKECGEDVYYAIVGELGDKKFNSITLDDDLTIANGNNEQVNILIAVKEYKTELSAAIEGLGLGNNVYDNVKAWFDVVNGIEAYIGDITTDFDDDEVFPVAGTKLQTLVDKLDNDWATIDDNEEYQAAKASLTEIKTFKKDYGKFLGTELEDGPINNAGSAVLNAYNGLNDAINAYLDITDDTELGKFVLAFDAILQKDLKEAEIDMQATISKKSEITLAEVVGEDTLPTMDLSKSSLIKNRIKLIKDHDNYDRFKNEDEVINILDTYQELLDNITTTKDVYKTDEYKDYTTKKVAVNNSTTKKTVKEFVNAIVEGKVDEKADKLAKTLNLGQWEILKNVKEEVIDAVYSMETKKVGKYYTDDSGFLSTVNTTQQNTFESSFADYLYALVDKEEGKFGYDVVAEHMEAFEKAFAAVTDDIAKLTPTNIKSTDKATLEAAEDAIYELQEGKYENNLTSDEKKEARKAATKITNLREAFDNLGTTTVAGWYDMGNGNWGYNNEDGTPAAYKWVASGSNWYFVRDGKMVRSSWLATDGGRWYYLDNEGKMVTNQSVDGCWINSYGVYMSPSYNG